VQHRPNRFERLENTLLDIGGVQPVQEQESADDVVGSAGVDDLLALFARVGNDLQQPFEADAVEVQHRLDDLLEPAARRRIGGLFRFMEHRIQALEFGLELVRI
jgi:hypothetical protein